MKPNGRRRWRKWAKKGLDIVSGFTSRRLNEKRYWNRWRRHRNAVDVTGPLPPLPLNATPFSPASLVGMTMGARKRAVRFDSFDLGSYQQYRIGERLRPCPGCSLCQPCAVCGQPSACVGLYDPWHAGQKPEPACNECCAHGCEDGHCEKRAIDELYICDGSGLLPARSRP